MVAFLVMASFVAYLLRTNMSVAGEPLMADLGLSRTQLGLVLAAFAWGYAIFQFPGGVFGEVVGVRRALALMILSWGVLNVLVGLMPRSPGLSPGLLLGTLVVLRFLMGAAQAPLFPVTCGGAICSWFPVSGWAFPNGLTNFGMTLGAAAAGPLIAWLMQAAGWRQSFVLTAPMAFLLAAAWWWYARDTPAEHPRVSRAELRLIDANRPPSCQPMRGQTAWRTVLANREVLLLTASYFCSNYLFYFFFNWLFFYLVENRGFRALEGGFLSAAPWITGGVGAVAGGLLCDRLTKRVGPRRGYAAFPIAGLLLAAGLIVAAALAGNPYVAVVYLALCLGFQQLTDPPYWAAMIAVTGRHASAACGVLNTGGNLAGGVVALVVPVTVEAAGWMPALATASAFAVLAALLWPFVRCDRPLEADPLTAPAPPGRPSGGSGPG
jgi:ACS family glucarate transporter-like MFS transporter